MLLVQSTCENKQQKTTHFLSITLAYLPPISVSLSANFFFSFFSAYLHSSVSFTPSHPVSIFLLFVCLCLTHCQFFHLFTSLSTLLPLSPVSLMCCWCRLKLCVVVMKPTEGQEWAQYLFTDTHEKCPWGQRGTWKRELSARAIQTIHGFSDHSSCQNVCVCAHVCVNVSISMASTFSGQDRTMWQSAWSEAVGNVTGVYSQQMWSHYSHTHARTDTWTLHHLIVHSEWSFSSLPFPPSKRWSTWNEISFTILHLLLVQVCCQAVNIPQ